MNASVISSSPSSLPLLRINQKFNLFNNFGSNSFMEWETEGLTAYKIRNFLGWFLISFLVEK
jgi:hypothetical protein